MSDINGAVGDLKQLYLEFFTRVLRRVRELGIDTRRTARARQFLPIATGRAGFSIVAEFLDKDRRLFVLLYIGTPDEDFNKHAFDQLVAQRDRLERELGASLEWRRLDDKRACRVLVRGDGTAHSRPDVLENMSNWAVEQMLSFKQVFESRIANL